MPERPNGLSGPSQMLAPPHLRNLGLSPNKTYQVMGYVGVGVRQRERVSEFVCEREREGEREREKERKRERERERGREGEGGGGREGEGTINTRHTAHYTLP